VNTIVDEWAVELACDDHVVPDFRSTDSTVSSYRTIAPALVRNAHHTADFLLEETRAMPAVDTHRAGETTPSFSDFVRLGAAVRGFLDAAVRPLTSSPHLTDYSSATNSCSRCSASPRSRQHRYIPTLCPLRCRLC
jgi:hypothetical protein